MEFLLQALGQVDQGHLITWVSFIAIMVLAIIFYQFVRHAHQQHQIDWTDLIKAKGTEHISLTKVIQLIGGTVSSWVIIKLTLQGNLTWDIFSLYLGYCAGTEGFSKYLSAKYAAPLLNKNQPTKD